MNAIVGPISGVGARAFRLLAHVGALWYLLQDVLRWFWRALVVRDIRLGNQAIVAQMVRIGVQSIFIVCLVSGAIGFILGLQMAPPLADLGQVELVPNIIAVAVLRELGPLIAAIVLTGFAGAAIAA